MSDRAFRTTLFFVLLGVFCVTAAIVLLAFAGILKHVNPDYEKWGFSALIVEAAASIFAFWKQLNASPFEDPPQVTGDWEYECVRDDDTYKHGGLCRIEVKRAPFGWEFTIAGKRTWISHKLNGEWNRKTLASPSYWDNTWGTFTGKDALRYAYSINTGGTLVQGYGWASLKRDTKGQPNVMEGNFFQLPPHDPFYGSQHYWRVASDVQR